MKYRIDWLLAETALATSWQRFMGGDWILLVRTRLGGKLDEMEVTRATVNTESSRAQAHVDGNKNAALSHGM